MTPLFSPSTELVGWFSDNGFIFNLDLKAVAFVSGDNAFSYPDCEWLGSADESTMRDRIGKPVCYNPGHPATGSLPPLKPLKPLKPLRPLTPLKPLNPLRPLRALTPLGGWSALDFDSWASS